MDCQRVAFRQRGRLTDSVSPVSPHRMVSSRARPRATGGGDFYTAAPRIAVSVRSLMRLLRLMSTSTQNLLGAWSSTGGTLALDAAAASEALHDIATPLMIVNTTQGLALGRGGLGQIGASPSNSHPYPLVGIVPQSSTEQLGDESFRADHGLRYAYVSGAMAAGIGSEAIVEDMAKHGMLGFFGAAGLSLSRVEAAIDQLQQIGRAHV